MMRSTLCSRLFAHCRSPRDTAPRRASARLRLTEVAEVRRTSRYSVKVLLRDGTSVPLAEAYWNRLETLLLES